VSDQPMVLLVTQFIACNVQQVAGDSSKPTGCWCHQQFAEQHIAEQHMALVGRLCHQHPCDAAFDKYRCTLVYVW
jgi:hypothetical protein